MPDEHSYNREAEDIDEIQEEDRQERMKKEKLKANHFSYLRHKESSNAEIASLEVKDEI